MNYLEDYKQSRFLLRANDILDTDEVADFIENNPHPLAAYIREALPHEVRQDLTRQMAGEHTKGALKQSIASALNTVLKQQAIPAEVRDQLKLSARTEALANSVAAASVEANRRIVEEAWHLIFSSVRKTFRTRLTRTSPFLMPFCTTNCAMNSLRCVRTCWCLASCTITLFPTW